MGLYGTVYDDWIREAEKPAEDRGEVRGYARGEATGEAREVANLRRLCLNLQTLRLGKLPFKLIESVNQFDTNRCRRLTGQANKIESVSELDWRE